VLLEVSAQYDCEHREQHVVDRRPRERLLDLFDGGQLDDGREGARLVGAR
jgi:hypothetical protein